MHKVFIVCALAFLAFVINLHLVHKDTQHQKAFHGETPLQAAKAWVRQNVFPVCASHSRYDRSCPALRRASTLELRPDGKLYVATLRTPKVSLLDWEAAPDTWEYIEKEYAFRMVETPYGLKAEPALENIFED